MITRHHLALTLMCTLLISSSLLPFDPVILAMVIVGSCTGAILPDFQMRKPKSSGLLTPAWLVAQFSRTICIPVMCFLYSVIFPAPPDAKDKRLTHSLPGVFFIFAAVAGISSVPLLIIRNWAVLSLVRMFLLGIILGLVLHLVEDLCTRTGISPLFPFGSVSISGSIRPCNEADRRIARFQAQHGTTLAAFLGLQVTGFLPAPVLGEMRFIGICAVLGLMIYLSDVTLDGAHPSADHLRNAPPVPHSFSISAAS
jgi:hypothetical protein